MNEDNFQYEQAQIALNANENFQKNFQQNLKAFRTSVALTQKDVAESLEVDPQTISRYETGRRFPNAEKIRKICELFDCTINELLSKYGKKENDERSYKEYCKESRQRINEAIERIDNYALLIQLEEHIDTVQAACRYYSMIEKNKSKDK